LIAGLVVAVLAIVGVVVFFLTREDGSSAQPDDTRVEETVDATEPSVETTDDPDPTDGPDPSSSGDIPPPADEPDGLGDDEVLDELAQDCYDGDMQACDDLFSESPLDSEYETYGDTCAGRQPENSGYCTVAFPG